jgi:GMP synthase-like glutamine amidotransferase
MSVADRNGAPVLILQHGTLGPPTLLADWLDARGRSYEIHRAWLGEPLPDPRPYAFVASLGWNRNPRDTSDPLVAAELDLLERAVATDVPVLGLCFGAQALAVVLGGDVETAPTPELGWREVTTTDPALVPAGPWLEWHFERFTTPPGAVEVARTDDAVQAFRLGPHLAVQFHPESTVEVVTRWAESDDGRLAALGIEDGAALVAAPEERVDAAREAAYRLFDAFVAMDGGRD